MSVCKTEVQDSKKEHEPFTTNPAKFSDERICCSAYGFMQFVNFCFLTKMFIKVSYKLFKVITRKCHSYQSDSLFCSAYRALMTAQTT